MHADGNRKLEKNQRRNKRNTLCAATKINCQQ